MDELLNFFNNFFPKRKSKQINEITARNSIEYAKSMTSNILTSDVLKSAQTKTVFPSLSVNLEYIKKAFNKTSDGLNNDICLKEFNIHVQDREFKAFLVYIDGLTNINILHNLIINPLIKIYESSYKTIPEKENSVRIVNSGIASNISVRRIRKFDLENYIYSLLTPQNSLNVISEFNKIIYNICSGKCVLFIDTLQSAFCINTNLELNHNFRYEFSHLIVNNTSIIRGLINNQNLIVEEALIGNITNTRISLCYLKNLVDTNILSEIKDVISSIEVDSILSSYQLKKLIHPKSPRKNSNYKQPV